MEYEILASGSSGNCVIINDIIAIDMGIPYRNLKDYYKNIRLVLLTHVHSLRSL